MVVYWVCFGPAYRIIRELSLTRTLLAFVALAALPWLAYIIPAAADDMAFYKDHKTGSLATALDHVVVTLKFNPLCYAHVFLFGMCAARFRRHVTLREDSYETSTAKARPPTQSVLMFPFRYGAVVGYLGLVVSFLAMGKPVTSTRPAGLTCVDASRLHTQPLMFP